MQRLPHRFIARRAGDKNKRRFRAAIARFGEGGEAVEPRHAMVGKDDVRRMMLQFVKKSVARFHPSRAESQARLAQLMIDQCHVLRRIFHDQDAKFFVHSDDSPSIETFFSPKNRVKCGGNLKMSYKLTA